MFKKILFTLLTLLIVYSCAVVGYRIFEPSLDIASDPDTAYLDIDSLDQYILSSPEGSTHYLFFYSRVNKDCVYVRDTVLSVVQKETQLNLSRIIEIADITSKDRSLDLAGLYEDWGISNYPAFASYTVQNGEIVMNNMLVYDGKKPLTAADIESWLELNGLYTID